MSILQAVRNKFPFLCSFIIAFKHERHWRIEKPKADEDKLPSASLGGVPADESSSNRVREKACVSNRVQRL